MEESINSLMFESCIGFNFSFMFSFLLGFSYFLFLALDLSEFNCIQLKNDRETLRLFCFCRLISLKNTKENGKK